MNATTAPAGLYADRLPAVQFRAWRIGETGQAFPLETTATTPEEVLAEVAPGCRHKDHLAILQSHAGRGKNTLRLYAIKQESKPVYRRNPASGLTEPFRALYPAPLFPPMPVHSFDPVAPFDAFRDCPVGRDLQLVEPGGAA